jgi:rare lipoprotein A
MTAHAHLRLSALMIASLVLAHCSAADKLGATSKYSAKIVEDGEPVPKGGGRYSVGKPYNINGRTYFPAENSTYRADGIASWYGPDFHGRQTANGEVYDMHGISAAHTTMPLPSYARVTNLDNGRSIIVRVNDRGPYVGSRIIDLSIGAAKQLDFYGNGLAHVRVEYVSRAPVEGSDDRMLMATLRHGGPAPAPSRVMVASSTPLLPFIPRKIEARGTEAEGAEAPLPPERPNTVGVSPRAPERNPKPEVATTATTRPPPRSVVRLPDALGTADGPAYAPPPAAAGFMPVRTDGGAALMSGRGLY